MIIKQNLGKAAAIAAILFAATACGDETNPLYGTWEAVDPDWAEENFGILTFHPRGNVFMPFHFDIEIDGSVAKGHFEVEEELVSLNIGDAYLSRDALVEMGEGEPDWDDLGVEVESVRVDRDDKEYPSFMEGNWRRLSWAKVTELPGPMKVSATYTIDDAGELILRFTSFGSGDDVHYYEEDDPNALAVRYRRVE